MRKFQEFPTFYELQVNVGTFKSVTVSKSGRVQTTSSHVGSSLFYYIRVSMGGGGYTLFINGTQLVLTLKINYI